MPLAPPAKSLPLPPLAFTGIRIQGCLLTGQDAGLGISRPQSLPRDALAAPCHPGPASPHRRWGAANPTAPALRGRGCWSRFGDRIVAPAEALRARGVRGDSGAI